MRGQMGTGLGGPRRSRSVADIFCVLLMVSAAVVLVIGAISERMAEGTAIHAVDACAHRRLAILRVLERKLTLTCRHARVLVLEDVETGHRYEKCSSKWRKGETLDATLRAQDNCRGPEVKILGLHGA